MMPLRANRRRFLHGLLFLSALSCAVTGPWTGLPAPDAMAKDDGGNDGGDGGGDSGGDDGSDDGGGGSSGASGGVGSSGTGSGGSSAGKATGSTSVSGHDTGLRDGPLAKSLRGKIATLREIEALARRKVSGEVLGIKLSKQGSDYVYSVRIMQPDGTIVDLEINAVSRSVSRPGIY